MHNYLFSVSVDNDTVDLYESVDLKDEAWNAFIEKSPYGQYEQADYWAQLKVASGWSCIRVIYKKGDTIIGGAQLLKRSVLHFLSIAYITRGPVFLDEHEVRDEIITSSLKYVSRKYRLAFILIQPPDACKIFAGKIDKKRYLKNTLFNLVAANLVIDLRQSTDEIFSGFKKDKRQSIRRAQKLKHQLIYGKKEDLPKFFALMKQTCSRQNVSPQPDSLEYLEKMWDIFAPADAIHLFFIEYDNTIVASSLEILFKRSIYRWKVGWSGEYPKTGITSLFFWEVMKWAKDRGCIYHVDVGVDPRVVNIGRNGKITPAVEPISMHKIRFGGKVDVFPESHIYSSYGLVRLLLRAYSRFLVFKG